MKFGLPLSLIFHSLAVFGGLLIFGKVVSDTRDAKIIPLQIVTIADQTNLKPTETKPLPSEELIIAAPPVEDINEEKSAPLQSTKTTDAPPEFNLDDFSKMIEQSRNDNPNDNQQKDLIGEVEKAKQAQNGAGETTDFTVNPADYIKAKMEPCWLIDKGAKNYQSLRVEVELKLDVMGAISMLRITNDMNIIASSNNGWRAARDNVIAALNECAPYRELKSVEYKEWKTMKLNFQPGETK